MKMINSSSHTVRASSELLHADTWTGEGARPSHVMIPPNGVVEVDDAYALRKRAPTTVEGPVVTLPSAVEQMVPQLQPYGDAAKQLFATKCVDDLDHVKRAYAELDREGKASAGTIEDAMVKAKIEKGIRDGLAHALGLDVPKPVAVPTIAIAIADEPTQ